MKDATPAAPGGISAERGGVVLSRVLAMLGDGPRSTMQIAAGALGITGSEGAAARAVWALLGDDSRFAVTREGEWSLRSALSAPPLRALRDEDWVVVDVETTGGSPGAGHRVTEVAAVRVSGGEIRETFSTLVNPQRRIPRMITSLTGINDEMVAGAPPFAAVVPQLTAALRGGVFVAHNAPFDWRFVSSETERTTGLLLAGRQLCTVRLSRKLLPQLPSRSLGALAEYFGLEIVSRHRALDDAVATAQLLLRLIGMLEDRGVNDWAALDALLSRRAGRRRQTRMPHSMDSA